MKNMIILPFAEKDIKATVFYYKEQNKGLEIAFIDILDSSLKEILKNPEAFPIVKFDIRKFVIRKFPFCIYYIDSVDNLYIIAVFHDKRIPKEWSSRRLKKKP